MTLTELKYVIAVAHERHFGRAAEQCNVSQPSLSVAVKKLEEELGVKIFERRSSDVTVTPIGSIIVEQAHRVIEEAQRIKECAEQGKDPLSSPLHVGVIYTVAPYLLPPLVHQLRQSVPTMPLILTENYTTNLLESLRTGQIDCAILALPVDQPGLMMHPLYDEEFIAAVPADHVLAKQATLTRQDLKSEPMLLLGSGHCFRDQVLDFCADALRGDSNGRKQVEGSSLQTIGHMVAQGLGVTVLPASAMPYYKNEPLIKLMSFERSAVPKRRIVLLWRKSFPRTAAIEALNSAVSRLHLNGCKLLTSLPAVAA